MFKGDLSLNLEKCGNCGLEMTPDHQCDIYTAVTTTPEKIVNAEGRCCEECNRTFDKKDNLKKHVQQIHVYCQKCHLIFNTNDHLKQHIQYKHALEPKCHQHTKESRLCRKEPGFCRLCLIAKESYREGTSFTAIEPNWEERSFTADEL